ncbi:MAG: DUF3226 domain-containing protein [Candidatus Xenobiia bacterium LiM19]
MTEINKSTIIVVEGADEENLFESLLKKLGVSDYDVKKVEGKGNFKTKLPTLIKGSGFRSNVKTLLVVRDADENAESAFESIKNIIKKAGLKAPPKPGEFSKGVPRIGIFIMPGSSDKGMLEDLCLRSVEKHPAMKCVNEFSNCISKLDIPPRNLSKARAQAFLAAMPEIINCVGLGGRKNYWDFDSPAFSDLREFLKKLL